MKFRFCGDLDAPDWILGEVSVLSKMSSVRMTLICRQVLQEVLGERLNWEKVTKLCSSSQFQLTASETKALIAALHFIFCNAAKYDVEESVLLGELMQLGLPKDISVSICRCYTSNKDRLRAHFHTTSFSLSRLQKVDWRLDLVLGSSALRELRSPSIRMQLQLSKSRAPVAFEMTAEKFKIFYEELKTVRALMEPLQPA